MMTDRDRTAGTASASLRQQPRQGRTSLVTRTGLRTLLPALFACLLLAGWTSGAGAVTYTPNPSFVCQGQTADITVSGLSAGASQIFYHFDSSGTAGAGTNYKILNSGGTEISDYTDIPITANANGRFTLRFQNISADGSVVFESYSYNDFTINFHPSTHADCATASDGVTVSPTSLALTELGSSSTVEKTYTVVLDTDPGVDVTITATNGDTSAVEVDTNSGTSGNQNTLTFTHGNSGNWSTAQTVTVRALNDLDSVNESFNITHAATATGNTAPYHGISVPSVAVTTADAGHGVAVSKSSLSVAANDETDTYTVVLKSRPSGNVVISATSGAAARATVSPGTLTFGTSDWNTPKTFTVTGKGAGSTSISHAVQSSADTTNYPTTTTIPAVSVTVTADSRQVLDLSFDSNSRNEGGTATMTVTATGAGAGNQVVAGGAALLTFSGDGIASSDYSVPAATNYVLFGGPPPSATVAINLANDNVDEPNETLTVGLQNLPAGYRAGTTASVTIVDRTPTTVTLAGGGTVMEDGTNSADVTVTLSRNLVAGETVTVPLAITGTGIAPGDYTIAPAPGSSLNRGVTLNTSNPHSAAQPAVVFTGHGTNTVQVATLRVTAVQDATDEGVSEALAVGFGSGNRAVRSNLDRVSGTGTTGTTTAGTATVTITDDDSTAVAVPEISMALQTGETSNRNTAGQLELVEAGGTAGAVFNLSADSVLGSTLTVCLQVTETGGDLVAAAAEGIRTATLTSSGNTNGAGIYTLTWADDTADERNSVVTATLVAPETVGCSAASGTYTVASAMASDAVFIEDDDATTVRLTSSDTSMEEGDATETAVLTFTLGRQLYADEAIAVPFALTTSTGARLPGHATPDFAVTAAGAGVTIANANTAAPSLTFTGHGTNTVRTATVTLTPVANRDDGDTAREEITATLAADSVLGSTAGSGTTVGGGAMRHGTDFAVDLTLEDDDAPPASTNELTLTLSSASAPEGRRTRDVDVTVAKPAGSVAVTYRLCFSGTATLDENGTQAAGEDYRIINEAGSVQTLFGSGSLAGCAGTGNIAFRTGVDSHTWKIRVFGDTAEEADETVVVTLSEGGTPLPNGWSVSSADNPATYTIVNDDAPPHVTLHTVDPVAVEGSSTNTAGIEVRLSGALDTGRTLTVDLETHTDIWGPVSLDGSPAGVAYSSPLTRQHRLVFTGPGAPTRARLKLAASANTVDGDGPRSRNPSVVALHDDTVSGDGLQSRDHYVELTGVTGYSGATVDSRKASRQFLQVIDSASTAGHDVRLQVYSEPVYRTNGTRRRPGEGDTAVLMVSAGGGRPVSVTVAVQPVTADFADLGRASEGGYLSVDNRYPGKATGWVGYQGRDGEQGLDLYTVSILNKPAPTVYMQIPIVDDGLREGPETFRAFIYRTPPGYSTGGGLSGTRVSTVEFTIPASDGGLPMNAAAVEVPDAQVSNLEVTRVDATSASASWDAVAHATGYEVAWDALDGNGQSIAGGLHAGVTGTTQTIEHQAPGAASLRVTVAPEHVDGNGDTQVLSGLAASAVLDLSTPQSAQADSLQAGAASCDLVSVKADVNRYILETQYGTAHVARWKKALAGLNRETGGMTAAGARQMKAKYSPGRWQPVVDGLDCLEKAAQPETPAAVPELSLAAGPAVDEGGSATFTVHADPAPAAALTVAFTVAQTGEYLSAPGAGSRTVTLAAGAASATLAIATADDGANEADGSVSVTLDAGTGYTLAAGKAAAKVAVRDNDTPAVSIAAGSGVTEGTPAAFTLTANPAPHADLTVTLAVTQSGDFAAAGETGTREVTIPAGGSAAFEVATVNDSADEPDGSVTATVGAGTGYAVAASPDDTASVAVADDDAAPGVPALAIGDVRANEGDGFMWFTVTLSPASDRAVSVDYRTRESNPVSARRNSDFLQVDFGGVTFRPGETSKRFWVYLFDDNHDEDPETFEVALSSPTGGARIADGVAVGTIVNDDPMPAAWLARFGRTVAEQALDGIAGRIAAPREAGARGTLAGQSLNFGTGSGSPGSQSGTVGAANDNAPSDALFGDSGFGAPANRFGTGGFGLDAGGFDAGGLGQGLAQSRTMTGLEALLGSSFTATGETDATGGSLAFWGRAAQSSFDGREGAFSLDGEATTAMLGADYARGRWLVGLALMQSSGEGGYADTGTGSVRCPQDLDAEMREVVCNGAVREGDGDVEASLTAAVPYAAIQPSERLRLWGAAGFGTGEVTLKPDVGGSLKSDLSWSMASAGVRGDLLAPPGSSGPALALTADGLWARTSSEKTHELAASESDVTRLRLGLEGSYRIALEEGGHVTPKLEIGARHDGGDAETGFGVELGGGLVWSDPTLGLSLDLSGRTLVSHSSDDLEDRGFAASLAFDPNPATKRGPSFSLRQDWGGSAAGGLDALFATDPLADRTGSAEPESRWQAEAAYGLPAFSGRYVGSPHVGFGLATGARDYTLGWRLSPAANANAPDLSFGVKGTRRESDTAAPEHTVGFEVNARW